MAGKKKKAAPANNGFFDLSYDLFTEIMWIIIIVFCVITILSLFTDGTGAFGAFIKKLLTGFFGAAAFLLPFALSGYGIWLLLTKKRAKPYKLWICTAAFVLVTATAHITGLDGELSTGLSGMAYARFHFSGGGLNNGGLLGAYIGDFSLSVLGVAGSAVLFSAAFIIMLILLTGKSFLEFLTATISVTGKASLTAARKSAAAARTLRDYMSAPYDDDEYEDEDYEDEYDEYDDEGEFEDDDDDEYEPAPVISLFRKPTAADRTSGSVLPKIDSEEMPPTGLPPIAFPHTVSQPMSSKPTASPPKGLPPIAFPQALSQPSATQPSASQPSGFDPNKDKLDALSRRAEQLDKKPDILPRIAGEYVFPPLDLLQYATVKQSRESKDEMLQNAQKLEQALASFGVEAKVIQINKGPTVTRYELSPKQGVKVSKIVNLSDDIALNLAASGIRIEAPIPGKAAVGIEVPNKERQTVYLHEIIGDETFRNHPSKAAIALGKDIAGTAIVADISKMPHLLIAGATGSGKSICINTILTSILYKAHPDEVKLLLVDPKVVELSVYNGIPHLLIPVVTDPKKAAGALSWAVGEMVKRYKKFAELNVRDMRSYNIAVGDRGEGEPMPHIIIVIDELADLMMAAPGDVEDSICRLAQMARAAGMHLIIATQRPSVDVITGLIKANIPSRLAFAVSSGTDSRTVLDMVGAEKLLGKGDMLFYPVGMSKPLRIQGALITDKEVESIVGFIKTNCEATYDDGFVEEITAVPEKGTTKGTEKSPADDDEEQFIDEATELVVAKEKASVSMLQRQFRIGYNRAARLMEVLEQRGIVGKEDGSKPRKVLMTKSELAARDLNLPD